MNAILALAIKDLRLLFRDKVGFFFTFFFPLLYAVFFGAIFSGQGGGASAMKIVVVDEDSTEGSKAFIRELNESAELDVDIKNRDEATNLVRRGKRVGYVVLPQGFGKARGRVFGGDRVKIETGIDPGRSAEAGMLQGVLTKYMYQGIQDAFANPDKMRKQINESLAEVQSSEDMDPTAKATLQWFLPMMDRFLGELPKNEQSNRGWQNFDLESKDVAVQRGGPQNSYEISFPQGIIWGVMGCAAAFGISLVVERTKGTLVRLRIAPIGRMHILAGKAFACLLTTMAIPIALLLLGIIAFGIRPDSWVLLSAGIISISLCFVGIMMMLSVLGRTEQSAGGIGWAVLLVMALIGGGMVPLFIMPAWMQTVSHVSPVKWSILVMEGAIWRNFSVAEMVLPCGILIGVGLVCFIIGTKAFRWTEG
jgi:ABC-2 type transport system permease protein